MPGKEIVGPLPTVRFYGGRSWDEGAVRMAYQPPRSTIDLRARVCTEHRVACDCREAEFAETRREYAGEMAYHRTVVNRVLAGHVTHAYYGGDVDWSRRCNCTGCQIARELHLRGLVEQSREGVPYDRPSRPSVADWHRQGPRMDGTWGCACGWVQDKAHAEHVADMVARALDAGDDDVPF